MQKTTLRAMMLFTLLTLPQAVLAGSITYDIVNYPRPPEWVDSIRNHHDGRNHGPNYPIRHHVMDVVDNEGGR